MPHPDDPLTSFADTLEFYATCGSGLDAVLAAEFTSLGFSGVQRAGAGVRFHGTLAEGYRACLWSRVANRVLLPIHRGAAGSPDELYELVQQVDWSEHLDVDGSLAVDFFTSNSTITHSQYGALKVKDAVVDQFRRLRDRRPDVDRETPDVRINVYLFRNQARIAIDLSGSSLHRRGYRTAAGLAPLKENLAAALLLAVDWPAAVEAGRPLYDPLCGSGTLLIEAAMIACHQAPGLLRHYFGFTGWKHHDDIAWQALLSDAKARLRHSPVPIFGADKDPRVVESCSLNLQAAGLHESVSVSCGAVTDPPPSMLVDGEPGHIVTNPPYGERLAVGAGFYAELGVVLSRDFPAWSCSLFTAAAAPYAQTRLPLSTLLSTRNGGIDCVLLHGHIPAAGRSRRADAAPAAHSNPATQSDETEHPQAALYRRDPTMPAVAVAVDATPFANRIRKNQRALKGWLKQNRVMAYRLYDADLPEFAVAVDIFHADTLHCVVQEYQAPATVNISMARARLDAVMQTLPQVLGIASEHMHLKVRQVQSEGSQYERLSAPRSGATRSDATRSGATRSNATRSGETRSGETRSVVTHVEESGARLEINLTDYLDTGLFLDHRPVRRYIQQNAQGKRFLNLFAYTATATVAAVIGGAGSSVSVDSSNRYCQWARRNLDNNGAAAQLHEVVRQDVFTWLEGASLGLSRDNRFDLVLLDPPTYSNSTDHDRDWNVQRDHVAAIDACLSLMAPGGVLIFSNNFRRFKMDRELLGDAVRGVRVEDRSRWSIDRDFQRNQRIHQCWFLFKD